MKMSSLSYACFGISGDIWQMFEEASKKCFFICSAKKNPLNEFRRRNHKWPHLAISAAVFVFAEFQAISFFRLHE